MRSWLIALVFLIVGLASAPPAAASSADPLQPVLRPMELVTQTQKEAWLLDAAARGNHALAWQIASQSFAVQSSSQVFTVEGLNVDLAYSGTSGTSLLSVLKRRARFYRHHPAELHAHLTNPDLVVHLDQPVDPRNILLPTAVANQQTFRFDEVTYHLVHGKLYRPEYRVLAGVSQLVLHYDPQATSRYASQLSTTLPTSSLTVTSREMTDAEADAWSSSPSSSFVELWEGS